MSDVVRARMETLLHRPSAGRDAGGEYDQGDGYDEGDESDEGDEGESAAASSSGARMWRWC